MTSISVTIATNSAANGSPEKSISQAFRAVIFVLASQNYLVSILSTDFVASAWPPVVKTLSLYKPDTGVVIHAQITPEGAKDSFTIVFHAGEDGQLKQIKPFFDRFIGSVKTHHPWLVDFMTQE